MSRGPGTTLLLPVVLALLLVPALWSVRHDTPPLGPDADLYTSLSVARHLLRGDGFRNGVVYPVSLSFPFAATVPQPLIERPPGVPLTVAPAVALAGDDPAAAVGWARRWWLLWLGLLAATGTAILRRRGQGLAAVPWSLGLVLSPLLAMGVAWCQVEVVVAWLLLLLWSRAFPAPRPRRIVTTGDGPRRRGIVDGLLWGGISLLRSELAWLPPLWLGVGGAWRDARRRWWAVALCLLVLLPWSARNLRVTGRPWFVLQAWTEHLKETPAAPGYSIYCAPRGESLAATLRHRPRIVLAKTAAGARYYLGRLARWLRAAAWLWLLLVALWPGAPGRRRALLSLGSVLLLIGLYSPFSHTLRYLAALLPVLLLEFWGGVTVAVDSWVTGRRWIVPATVIGLGLVLTGGVPTRLPGWARARGEAARLAPLVPAAVRRAAAAPPGPLLSDTAAVLWFSDRDGVWWPGPDGPPAWLRRAAPGLAEAPWIRLATGSMDQGQDERAQQAER